MAMPVLPRVQRCFGSDNVGRARWQGLEALSRGARTLVAWLWTVSSEHDTAAVAALFACLLMAQCHSPSWHSLVGVTSCVPVCSGRWAACCAPPAIRARARMCGAQSHTRRGILHACSCSVGQPSGHCTVAGHLVVFSVFCPASTALLRCTLHPLSAGIASRQHLHSVAAGPCCHHASLAWPWLALAAIPSQPHTREHAPATLLLLLREALAQWCFCQHSVLSCCVQRGCSMHSPLCCVLMLTVCLHACTHAALLCWTRVLTCARGSHHHVIASSQ